MKVSNLFIKLYSFVSILHLCVLRLIYLDSCYLRQLTLRPNFTLIHRNLEVSGSSFLSWHKLDLSSVTLPSVAISKFIVTVPLGFPGSANST